MDVLDAPHRVVVIKNFQKTGPSLLLSTEIYFYLIDIAEIVYASCSTGLTANLLLRKPNKCSRVSARLVRSAVSAWIQAEGTKLYPRSRFYSRQGVLASK